MRYIGPDPPSISAQLRTSCRIMTYDDINLWTEHSNTKLIPPCQSGDILCSFGCFADRRGYQDGGVENREIEKESVCR